MGKYQTQASAYSSKANATISKLNQALNIISSIQVNLSASDDAIYQSAASKVGPLKSQISNTISELNRISSAVSSKAVELDREEEKIYKIQKHQTKNNETRKITTQGYKL